MENMKLVIKIKQNFLLLGHLICDVQCSVNVSRKLVAVPDDKYIRKKKNDFISEKEVVQLVQNSLLLFVLRGIIIYFLQ